MPVTVSRKNYRGEYRRSIHAVVKALRVLERHDRKWVDSFSGSPPWPPVNAIEEYDPGGLVAVQLADLTARLADVHTVVV